MSFSDALKKSLGFEEELEDPQVRNNLSSNGMGHNDFGVDDVSISPEQDFYEIKLIRPKTIDDINYVVDQVLGENNPVIMDLAFLEKESPSNFRLAGEKIKSMRNEYGAAAVLLARSEDKHLIIVTPRKISLIRKD